MQRYNKATNAQNKTLFFLFKIDCHSILVKASVAFVLLFYQKTALENLQNRKNNRQLIYKNGLIFKK